MVAGEQIEVKVSEEVKKLLEEFKSGSLDTKNAIEALKAKMEEQEKARKEADEKANRIISPDPNGTDNDGAKLGMRQFLKACKSRSKEAIQKMGIEGLDNLDSPHVLSTKVLVEGTPASGGYLVPVAYAREIINLVIANSPVMQISRKFQVPNFKLNVPTVSSGNTGYWIDEASEKTASDITFGQVAFTLYKACVLTPVSNELLEDSDPSVEAVIREQFALCIENTVEKAYCEGTGGAGDPITGLYSAITTNVFNAGASVTFDDIFDAVGSVLAKGGSNISILYNPKTEGTLRKIKGTDGQYIWGDATGSSPATIMGFKCYPDYNISTNLGVGGNESYIVVGDFRFAGVALKSGRGSLVIDVGLNASDFAYDKTTFRGVFRTDFKLLDETKFAIIKKVK